MTPNTRKWRYLRKLFRRTRARLDGLGARLVRYDPDAVCQESALKLPDSPTRRDCWAKIEAPTNWLVAERLVLATRRPTWLDRLRADLWLSA